MINKFHSIFFPPLLTTQHTQKNPQFSLLKLAGAIIGKGGQNIQKLRTEVCKETFIRQL